MVENAYINKMKEKSTHHDSTQLECGCELILFEFEASIRPRTLIHRCPKHNMSMVVESDMSVFKQYQRQNVDTEE